MYVLSAIGRHSKAYAGAAVAKTPHGNLRLSQHDMLERMKDEDIPVKYLTNNQDRLRGSEERNKLEQTCAPKCTNQDFFGSEFRDKASVE